MWCLCLVFVYMCMEWCVVCVVVVCLLVVCGWLCGLCVCVFGVGEFVGCVCVVVCCVCFCVVVWVCVGVCTCA